MFGWRKKTKGVERQSAWRSFLLRLPKSNFHKKNRVLRMRLAAVLFIGYRNIMVNKFRSFLTIGGVAIGIGIITFLIGIGFGFQEMVIREVTRDNPLNVIDINNSNLDNFISLNEENISRIGNISGVMAVEQIVNAGGKVYYEESQTDSIIYGTTREYFRLASIPVSSGSVDHDDEHEKVAVSKRLAGLLGFDNPNDMIGKRVKYDIILSDETNSELKKSSEEKDNEAEVMAIVDDGDHALAYFPYHHLAEVFSIDLAQSGKVEISPEADLNGIRTQIENLGFVTESVTDIVQDINSFFLIVKVVLIVFGVIIMSISAMGMLNTLSVSLLQRTKEVGILKALGAKRGDIFKMFIFEAALISFLGGALGFFGGQGFAWLINFLFNFFAHRNGVSAVQFVSIPVYFIMALLGFIVFLGLATGILPARRASKIHALDALRYE